MVGDHMQFAVRVRVVIAIKSTLGWPRRATPTINSRGDLVGATLRGRPAVGGVVC